MVWEAGPVDLHGLRQSLPPHSSMLSTVVPYLPLLGGGERVDFQGLLALLGDFSDSHVNLGQAVCSFECGNIVC